MNEKKALQSQALSQYEQDLTQKYTEGNSTRAIYFWAKNRFILEYTPEEYPIRFFEFLKECREEHLKEDLQNHVAWIAHHPAQREDWVQEYWSEHPKRFLDTLLSYREQGVMDSNLEGQLLEFAQNINNDPLRYIYEIIQNADDCDYPDGVPSITIKLTDQQKIEVHYNEKGMTYADIIALTTIGQSNKRNRKNKRLIGEKGIGFKTIFSVCSHVDVYSGSYAFQLADKTFAPHPLPADEQNVNHTGTRLILHLKESNRTDSVNGLTLDAAQIFENLLKKYGFVKEEETYHLDKQKAFQDCPVLFTNCIRELTIQHENRTFSIRNKESACRVSYNVCEAEIATIEYESATKNVVLTYEEYCSRYKDQYTDQREFDRLTDTDKKSITYPIAIIAAKDTENINQGCLYSYLPTSTKIKAPINIQLPVKLNLDRSCIFFEGDADTNLNAPHSGNADSLKLSLWSERMIQELYQLIPDFYNTLKKKLDIFSYIPSFQQNNHQLFTSDAKYSAHVEKLNKYCGETLFAVFQNISYFKKDDGSGYCTAEQAVMFDEWLHQNFMPAYFEQTPASQESNKFLVEYNARAVSAAKCFKFEPYTPNEAGQEKTFLLNATLRACYDKGDRLDDIIEKVMAEIGKNSGPQSQYLPEDIRGLTIFPARIKSSENQKILFYQSYSKKGTIWFKYTNKDWAYTKENSKIRFLSKNDIPFPDDIEFHECTPESLWDHVFSEKINKDTFEDLMDLMFRAGIMTVSDENGEQDWKEAAKQLLRSESLSDFWTESIGSKIPRISQLVNYLVEHASEFAEKAGE